jgi:hypothetical protein
MVIDCCHRLSSPAMVLHFVKVVGAMVLNQLNHEDQIV